MAPEVFNNDILTDKCDVYSFGIVLFEVVSAKSFVTTLLEIRPKQQNEEILQSFLNSSVDRMMSLSSHDMLNVIAEHFDPALAGNIAPQCFAAYKDLMVRCLNNDPNERPIMGEVEVLLEHALNLQQEAEARDTSE